MGGGRKVRKRLNWSKGKQKKIKMSRVSRVQIGNRVSNSRILESNDPKEVINFAEALVDTKPTEINLSKQRQKSSGNVQELKTPTQKLNENVEEGIEETYESLCDMFKIIGMTVQVPSIESLFGLYGKYIAVSVGDELGEECTQTSVASQPADIKAVFESEQNTIHREITDDVDSKESENSSNVQLSECISNQLIPTPTESAIISAPVELNQKTRLKARVSIRELNSLQDMFFQMLNPTAPESELINNLSSTISHNNVTRTGSSNIKSNKKKKKKKSKRKVLSGRTSLLERELMKPIDSLPESEIPNTSTLIVSNNIAPYLNKVKSVNKTQNKMTSKAATCAVIRELTPSVSELAGNSLPKRVSLKKNLMEQMLRRVKMNKNPPIEKEKEDVMMSKPVVTEVNPRPKYFRNFRSPSESGSIITEVNKYDVSEELNIRPVTDTSVETYDFGSNNDGIIIPKLEAYSCASEAIIDSNAKESVESIDNYLSIPDSDTEPANNNHQSNPEPVLSQHNALKVQGSKACSDELRHLLLAKLLASKPPPRRSPSPNCISCGLSFLTLKSLTTHLIECHNMCEPTDDSAEVVNEDRISEKSIEDKLIYPSSSQQNIFDAPKGIPTDIMKHSQVQEPSTGFRKSSYDIRCAPCGLNFLISKNLQTHLIEYHYASQSQNMVSPFVSESLKPFDCDSCNESFSTVVGLKIHKETQHPLPNETKSVAPGGEKIVYVCSYPGCQSQFSKLQNMEIHKWIKHKNNSKAYIKCVICPAKVSTASKLFYHLQACHAGLIDNEGLGEFYSLGIPPTTDQITSTKKKQKTPTCRQCNISFQWEANLEAHKKEFHNELRIVSVYGARKTTPTSLDSSKKSVQKSYDQRNTQIKEPEIITLSDDEDVEIVRIESNVSLQSKLIQSVSNSTLTFCPYCYKSIDTKNLLFHVEIHADSTAHKTQKFSCPYCSEQRFETFKEVQSHSIAVHSKQVSVSVPPKYNCKFCSNVTFKKKQSYDSHMELTHGRRLLSTQTSKEAGLFKIILCKLCDNLTFTNIDALKRHCQIIHPETSPLDGPNEENKEIGNPPGSTLTVTPIAATHSSELLQISEIRRKRARLDEIGGKRHKELEVLPLLTITEESSNTNKQVDVVPLLIHHKCTICGSTEFNNQLELNRHNLTHRVETQKVVEINSSNSFVCQECNLPFLSLDDLNQHSVFIHNRIKADLPALCPLCKAIIRQGRNLPRHIFSKHNMYQCICCSQIMTGKEKFLRHQQLHDVQSEEYENGKMRILYRCLECLETFSTKPHLYLHYDSLHRGGDKCTCATCNIQLQRKHLKTHLELHKGEITLGIGDSERRMFKRPTTAQSVKPHIFCSEKGCQKTFKSVILKDMHMDTAHRRHETVPPVNTEADDVEMILPDGIDEEEPESVNLIETFSENSGFEFEDVAIGEEDSEVSNTDANRMNRRGLYETEPIETGFNFNYLDYVRSSLNTSMSDNSFTPLPEFMTVFEPNKFNAQFNETTKQSSETHKEKEKPFICEFCPKKFLRKDNRDCHIKRVHKSSNQVQQCSYCGECYKNDIAFNRHINQVHFERIQELQAQSKANRPSGKIIKAKKVMIDPLQTVTTAKSTDCRHCGMSFVGVGSMERRKHELVHFEHNQPSASLSASGGTGSEEHLQGGENPEYSSSIQFTDDEFVDVENVLLPMDMMMKSEIEEAATTTEDIRVEYQRPVPGLIALERRTSSLDHDTNTNNPGTLAEFMAML